MQQMQSIFNSHMEPIQTHEDYPKYARSGTKPVVRARHIIDQGVISDHPCSTCVDLKQDCYRWEGTFSKCAYCTSKDKKKEFCHLPGQEASQERRKRRKITHNIYAPSGDVASVADTMMSGTLVTGTLASGTSPFPNIIPMSIPKSVRSLEQASTMTGIIHAQAAPPTASEAKAEAASEATLERVTALENQVSSLEAKVMELLVKLDEVSSCVSSSSTPRGQAAAGASPSSPSSSPTTGEVTFKDLQARHLSNAATAPLPLNVATAARRATREWVEGPKIPDALSPMEDATVEEAERSPRPEHSIEHAEGYKPVNCSCMGLPWSLDDNAVMRSETHAGDEDAFSVLGMAGRGNLF